MQEKYLNQARLVVRILGFHENAFNYLIITVNQWV
jgi:hypothetical protein